MSYDKHYLGLGLLYGLIVCLTILTLVVESRAIATEVKPVECEMDIKMHDHTLTLVRPCRVVNL